MLEKKTPSSNSIISTIQSTAVKHQPVHALRAADFAAVSTLVRIHQSLIADKNPKIPRRASVSNGRPIMTFQATAGVLRLDSPGADISWVLTAHLILQRTAVGGPAYLTRAPDPRATLANWHNCPSRLLGSGTLTRRYQRLICVYVPSAMVGCSRQLAR